MKAFEKNKNSEATDFPGNARLLRDCHRRAKRGGGVASQPKIFCRLAFPPPVYLFLVHAPEDCTVTDYCFGTWNLEDGGQGWLKKKNGEVSQAHFGPKSKRFFRIFFYFCTFFAHSIFLDPVPLGPWGAQGVFKQCFGLWECLSREEGFCMFLSQGFFF